MNQHPARISRPSPPSTTAGSRGAGLAALALAWVCASCEGASYSRLSILGATPDAGIRGPRAYGYGYGYGDASVGEVPLASGSGGSTGPGDLLAGAGATDPPSNPAPDGNPSVPTGSMDAPDAGGSAAPSATGGATGLSSGGIPGSSATGGFGPGGATGNAASGLQPSSGGVTGNGVGLPATGGGATSATGGAPGATGGTLGTGGATAIASGGATGAAAAATGGATVPVDNAHYNFETSSQLWGIATNTAAFTLIEHSTAQHFAGSASLAGTLSAVAGRNYFLEVAPPVPAIPLKSTITFHVHIPATAQLSAVRCYVLDKASTLAFTDTQASALERDGWTTVTLAVPATETNIIRLGVKFFSSGTWTGTVYVDSIDW